MDTGARGAARSSPAGLDSIAAAAPADPVFLSIRVHTTRLTSVRRCLHDCIGTEFLMYAAKVDYASGVSVLELKADRRQVDSLMTAVMRRLPEAEFGAVRTAHMQ